MTIARKKQVLAAALLGFTLWPLVQMELVRRFSISPWKLAGWGMYSTPRIAPAIAVLVQKGDEAPAPLRDVPADIRLACEDFQHRRIWLGDLAPPDEIGRMVLAGSGDYREASIVILQPVLDTASGRMHTETENYRYERRDPEVQR